MLVPCPVLPTADCDSLTGMAGKSPLNLPKQWIVLTAESFTIEATTPAHGLPLAHQLLHVNGIFKKQG